MHQPILTVIVPVYNVSAYLPACLDSLLRQSLSRLEILCIDDASQDDSARIVSEYCQKDSRVRLLTQPHLGVSAARNLGIDHAAGKYIAFVDADDWADPDMFRRLVDAAEEAAADMAFCSATVQAAHPEDCDPDALSELRHSLTVPNQQFFEGACAGTLMNTPGVWPFIWNKVIRSSCIREHSLRFSSELALGEDGVFIHLLLRYLNRVVCIPEPLYNYRYLRKDSATKNLFQDQQIRFRHHIGVVRILLHDYQARGLLEGNGTELLQWIIRFLYFGFICLPAASRRVCAPEIRELYHTFHLSRYRRGLHCIEKRRLHNLLSVRHADLLQKPEIFLTIAEDKLLSHL